MSMQPNPSLGKTETKKEVIIVPAAHTPAPAKATPKKNHLVSGKRRITLTNLDL